MIKRSKLLVAIADDHKLVRGLLVKHLNTDPELQVIVDCQDGIEMLDNIGRHSVLPDVCLIDINMPKMGGLELLIKIKKVWPSIKCIVLTAFNDDITIINMIKNGAVGYLLKNIDPQEVITAIKSTYYDGYYYSEVADNRVFRLINSGTIKAPTFTELETSFMRYCCSSLSYSDIAQAMGITYRSLDSHRDKIFAKLNVNSRTAVAVCTIQLGIYSIVSNSQIN